MGAWQWAKERVKNFTEQFHKLHEKEVAAISAERDLYKSLVMAGVMSELIETRKMLNEEVKRNRAYQNEIQSRNDFTVTQERELDKIRLDAFKYGLREGLTEGRFATHYLIMKNVIGVIRNEKRPLTKMEIADLVLESVSISEALGQAEDDATKLEEVAWESRYYEEMMALKDTLEEAGVIRWPDE